MYLGRSAWYVPGRAFLTLPQQPVDPGKSGRVSQVRQEAGEGTPPRLLVDGVEQPGLAIPLRDDHAQHAVELWLPQAGGSGCRRLCFCRSGFSRELLTGRGRKSSRLKPLLQDSGDEPFRREIPTPLQALPRHAAPAGADSTARRRAPTLFPRRPGIVDDQTDSAHRCTVAVGTRTEGPCTK